MVNVVGSKTTLAVALLDLVIVTVAQCVPAVQLVKVGIQAF